MKEKVEEKLTDGAFWDEVFVLFFPSKFIYHACINLSFFRACFRVCPGVTAGASRDYPGHLGSFNRRAGQSSRVQLAICYPQIPPRQFLPHHVLPLQRVLCQHRRAAGL